MPRTGVDFTGTVRILKASVRNETLSLTDADTILQKMIHAGYHSPGNRISSLL